MDAAHEKGIKVILDIVTNHVGQAFFYDINKNGQPDDTLMGQEVVLVILWIRMRAPAILFVSPSGILTLGIQVRTSLGPSGNAPIEFVNMPEIGRVAPYPAIFADEDATIKGRVTVWSSPSSCDCSTGRCNSMVLNIAHWRSFLLELMCSCNGESCAFRDDQACLRTRKSLGIFRGLKVFEPRGKK